MAQRAQVRKAGGRGRTIWTSRFYFIIVPVTCGFTYHVSWMLRICIPKYTDRRGNVFASEISQEHIGCIMY